VKTQYLKKKNESPKVQQEALTRLLVEKGIFTKQELLEMVRMVDKGNKNKQG